MRFQSIHAHKHKWMNFNEAFGIATSFKNLIWCIESNHQIQHFLFTFFLLPTMKVTITFNNYYVRCKVMIPWTFVSAKMGKKVTRGGKMRNWPIVWLVHGTQIGCHDDFLVFCVYFSLVNDMNGQKFFTTVKFSVSKFSFSWKLNKFVIICRKIQTDDPQPTFSMSAVAATECWISKDVCVCACEIETQSEIEMIENN